VIVAIVEKELSSGTPKVPNAAMAISVVPPSHSIATAHIQAAAIVAVSAAQGWTLGVLGASDARY
jgi:hypothetical protein